MWLITNKSLSDNGRYTLLRSSGYKVLTDQPLLYGTGDCNKWLIDGYILLRGDILSSRCPLKTVGFLNSLYLKYSDDLIHHIKGSFVLIRIAQDGFKVFSDHFGIKKFFIFQNNYDFIISNDLRVITAMVSVTPSFENMAVYALTYHFVDGLTLFNEIRYNDSAEIISFRDKRMFFSKYWDPEILLHNSQEIISPVDLANKFAESIKSCFSLLESEKVSLSLTGGVDSRLLFSVLLDQNSKLHTYTYGNPESFDCKVSKIIARDFIIPHSIHDIKFNKETFKVSVDNALKLGQSLCSLHRAHRLKAIEMEAAYAEAMFLGTMGGEFVKGANRGDYIISDFVYEFSRNPEKEILIKYLKEKAIKIAKVDIDKLMNFFIRQSWCDNPYLVDFYGLVEIAARLHHAQNDMLYCNYFKYVFNPYIDIDYLIALFQSRYNLLQKKKYHTNFFRRLNNLSFASEIQTILNKQLTEYPYSSGFLIGEYRLNKVYAAIRSRLRKKAWKNIPNFPLGSFINEFTIEKLKKLLEK